MNSNTDKSGLLSRGSVFGWIAAGTAALLMIPWVAMQITDEVDWNVMDFLAMGLLLFGSGSVYVLIARKIPQRYLALLGIVVAVAFVLVWAELAVGVFTS